MEKSRVKIGEKIENSSTRAKREGWTRYTAIRRKIASEVACARLHKRIQWDEKKRKGGREERNKKKKKLAGSRKGGGGGAGEEKRREEKAARWGSPAGTNNGRQNAVGHPLPSFLKRREIGGSLWPGEGGQQGWSGPVTVKISDLSGQR